MFEREWFKVFNKGDLLQYGNNGICCVQDIVFGMNGYDMETEYYLLVPISSNRDTIYLPTNNEKAKVRPVLHADDVEDILAAIDAVNEFQIVNEKQCEIVYKEAIYSLDIVKWMELLKTLCIRKQTRALSGKKVTSTDEKYFKSVSGRIAEELKVVLGEERADSEINKAIEIFEGCVSL